MMSKTLAALYLMFGLLLSVVIPRWNDFNAERFSNWHTDDSLLVRAFHVPGYIWFISFAMFGIALLLIGRRLRGRSLSMLNIGSAILLVLLFIHFFDWMSMFLFCHEWGCGSGFLPTWNLLR